MKRAIAIAVAVAVSIGGCATPARTGVGTSVVTAGGLIFDAKNVGRDQLINDGNECAVIASESNAGEQAAAGAIAGAAFTALLGALIFRGSGLSGNRGATYGAGLGALTGGASGAAHGAQDFKTVMRNCMLSRGHRPLN
jgi:hypothetical protein